jgi:hypothetical protein
MHKITYLALFVVILLPACSLGKKSYIETVLSGIERIPAAQQIEELIGDSDHFITHFGFGEQPLTWNTEVYFHQRYRLALQVKVMVDYQQNRVVEVVGEPKFYMREIENIIPIEGGRYHAKIGTNWNFNLKDWEKVVEASGDFSSIGIELTDEPLPYFDELVAGVRKSRIKIP